MHVLDEVQIHTSEGEILRAIRGMSAYVRWSIYSKRFSRGKHRYAADADWGVVDGVHIGAT